MDCKFDSRGLRVLVAPDSFKGSLEAHDVARHIAAGILRAAPESVVTEAPIADGGEGTAQALARRLQGDWHVITVLDANREKADVRFAACHSPALGSFAIFDVAEIVGLPDARLPPGQRSTRGVGQAIAAIAALGHETIVVGLGGSSTNDGGAGLLAELMFNFASADQTSFHPVLDDLHKILTVHQRPAPDWLAGLRLIGLTDVTSPLNGPNGASHIFGAQKGVSDLEEADRKLASFAARLSAWMDDDYTLLPGAGAAGGLGFALRLLGGSLQPGAEFILDALGLNEDTAVFDWIITGEGRSDVQTLMGKGPALVAAMARRRGIPVTLLSGAVDHSPELGRHFDGCFSIQAAPGSLETAMRTAGPLLEEAAFNLTTFFSRAERLKPAT